MKKKILTVITVFTDGSTSIIPPDRAGVHTADDPIGQSGDGDNDADDGGNNPDQAPEDP